jgi:hypothetical protein
LKMSRFFLLPEYCRGYRFRGRDKEETINA